MATSYLNTGGRGDRRSIITTTTTAVLSGGSPAISGLVDGLGGTAGSTNTGAPFWDGAQTLRSITFQFLTGKALIQEVTYFQNGNAAQGTWKWRGSQDGSSWTDLSATFTLDAPSVGAVAGDLSANTTAYSYYQLLQTAGTTNSSPWLREYEFKIEIQAGFKHSTAVYTGA